MQRKLTAGNNIATTVYARYLHGTKKTLKKNNENTPRLCQKPEQKDKLGEYEGLFYNLLERKHLVSLVNKQLTT